MVSSRSGLVDRSATGAPISSSTWRTYLIACAGRSAQLRAPTVDSFQPSSVIVDRLHASLRRLACRQMVDLLAVEHVADADLQLVETVEHIELGQRNAGDAVGRDRLAYKRRHRTSRSGACVPSRRTEFMALLAKELADLESLSSVGNGPSPTRVV